MTSQMSYVDVLTKDTFEKFLDKHELVFVAFVMPDMSRNTRFLLAYGKAAAEMRPEGVKFTIVNVGEEKEISSQHHIRRYPMIYLFKASKVIGSYEAPWTPSDFVSYARRHLLPVVSTVTAASLPLLKDSVKVLVIGYFDLNDTDSKTSFESLATAYHQDYVFGICTDVSLAEAEKVQIPSLVVYKDFDEGKEILPWIEDSEAVLASVKSASIPLIVAFYPEIHTTYGKIPLGYIFLGKQTVEQQSDLEKMIIPLAKRYKGKIQFGTMNPQISRHTVEDMHLNVSSEANWPTFAIREPIRNFRYLFDKPEQRMPTQQELAQYIEDFFDGKLKRSIKSEPVPEEPQQDAVQTIVGDTYESLVIDNEKDVFIEYFTQWCGPCRAMAPQLEKLAELYKADSEGSQKVLIGKMDAEANDVSGDIRGYPWLLLYPADNKDKPIQFLGKRTAEEMAGFVRDNGKWGIDVVK